MPHFRILLLDGNVGVPSHRNIARDGFHAYTYDAEGRLISVDGATTYGYDAEGQRASTDVAGTPREYLYDLSHRVADMMRSNPRVFDRAELYLANWHVATYAMGWTEFNHADWLGTVRVRTNPTGGVIGSWTSLPFGDCLTQVGGSACNGIVGDIAPHFTDQDRDAESGLDHFLARQYSSVQGRWTTPDPGGLAVVDPTNPQSWNRYAYVMNNPLAYVDPDGTSTCDASGCSAPESYVSGIADVGPIFTDTTECFDCNGDPLSVEADPNTWILGKHQGRGNLADYFEADLIASKTGTMGILTPNDIMDEALYELQNGLQPPPGATVLEAGATFMGEPGTTDLLPSKSPTTGILNPHGVQIPIAITQAQVDSLFFGQNKSAWPYPSWWIIQGFKPYKCSTTRTSRGSCVN